MNKPNNNQVSSGKISPCRLMNDLLLFRALPYMRQPALASGWESRGDAWFRPFNKVPAGSIYYGAGLRLPDKVDAAIEFLDHDLQCLHSVKIPAGVDSFICGTFEQQGELAAVRITPSEPVIGNALEFSRPFKVTANWAADESFSYTPVGQLPENWQGRDAGVYSLPYRACMKIEGQAGFDKDAADNVLRIMPGGFAVPFVNETLLTGRCVFEFDALVEDGTDFSFGGTVLREHYGFTDGIWYHFRFENDCGKVLLKINGRDICGDLQLFGWELKNLSAEKVLLIDDVHAFALEFPDDYVPEPQRPAGFGKYNLGIAVCPLWCHGSHWGWRCIDQCGDREPVLGFYDEGSPETADWEIKYMVESGITFQAFCWYPESHEGPIRHPRMDMHLRDGFKNSRYSGMMKYCLIWEVENAGRPHTVEAWKKNYIPYLIEHHFKDPRYLTLDNKLVMSVFAARNLISEYAFGSVEKCREAFDALDEAVRKLGFDGVIWIETHQHIEQLKAMGFDATASYNCGRFGYKLSENMERNRLRADNCPGVMPIPTVSVGFDSLPWHGIKIPMIKKEDYRKALLWCRDEFLPSYAEKGTWQENTFWLSTWNEYGEGTYIMPTKNADGFRYLDVIRGIFTDEPEDEALHIVPAPEQLERINVMYPRIGHPLVRSKR